MVPEPNTHLVIELHNLTTLAIGARAPGASDSLGSLRAVLCFGSKLLRPMPPVPCSLSTLRPAESSLFHSPWLLALLWPLGPVVVRLSALSSAPGHHSALRASRGSRPGPSLSTSPSRTISNRQSGCEAAPREPRLGGSGSWTLVAGFPRRAPRPRANFLRRKIVGLACKPPMPPLPGLLRLCRSASNPRCPPMPKLHES